MTHVTESMPSSRDSAVTQFLNRARAATKQFGDRSAAIASGYRRLGMDFPSMGEHWVNPGIILAGRFDVSRPAMLSYAMTDGKPVLTGLVYAVTLAPGEDPPAVPGGVGMWHEHNGTVDDESMLPEHQGAPHGASHDASHSPSSTTAGTRLAILHAWTGISNPAGIFAADNWALPFARLGFATPMPLSVGAARALSLLTGGKEYYMALANADGSTSDSVLAALDSCARATVPIVARAHPAGVLAPADVAQLEDAWTVALSRIASEAGPLVAKRLNGGRPITIATTP